jgi:hypothetical protein
VNRRGRRVRQIVATATGALFAVADDGTVWRLSAMGGPWAKMPPLPDGEPCGSNIDRGGDTHVCDLAAGHTGPHTDGGREW